MTGTTVAKADEKMTVSQLLKSDKAKAFLAPFLQKGVSVERVLAQAQLAVSKTPTLLECTPRSVLEAVARIESMDLEVGVTAHLVPFNTKVKDADGTERWENTCTAIADYKGLIELLYRAGAVRMFDAAPVYEKDVFRYSLGLAPALHHEPAPVATRGKLIGAWGCATLAFGAKMIRFMPVEDIDAIRLKHSKQWKQGSCPPWYACKTVVRQMAKLLPKNAKLAKALESIRQEEVDEFGVVVGAPGDGPRVAAAEAPKQLAEATTSEIAEPCPECGAVEGHFAACPLVD